MLKYHFTALQTIFIAWLIRLSVPFSNAAGLSGNVGMFDWSYFDNSKLIMFDDWKVLFV